MVIGTRIGSVPVLLTVADLLKAKGSESAVSIKSAIVIVTALATVIGIGTGIGMESIVIGRIETTTATVTGIGIEIMIGIAGGVQRTANVLEIHLPRALDLNPLNTTTNVVIARIVRKSQAT